MKFTEELREAAAPIWEAWHRHPFVTGIGDGSLDIEVFKYWLRQDYVYLKDYVRVFALGAAKADNLSTMSTFAKLLDGTLNSEMQLHRQYADRFGISHDELENEPKSPTTQGYTDFLLAASYSGDLAQLVAALLPCAWGFWEIGTRLKEVGVTTEDNPYRDWIETYSSEEFTQFCVWTRDLMDRLAQDLPRDRKQHLAEVFITSSRYELMFWDMAYNMEEWEV